MLVVLVEEAAEFRLDTEHIEVVAGDFIVPVRLREALGADPRLADAVTGDGAEGRIALLEVEEVGVGLADVAMGLLLDHAQAVCVGDVERAQDSRIHHAEDDQIGGDGDGEGEDCREGEAGRMAKAAGGDAQTIQKSCIGFSLEAGKWGLIRVHLRRQTSGGGNLCGMCFLG